MRKLIVVFGPPRTGTTFMHNSLLAHSLIYGYSTEGPKIKERKTNENHFIDTRQLGVCAEIDRLYEYYVKDSNGYLILKAPGYVFHYDYFKSLPYTVKFIGTFRPPESIIRSMLEHHMSKEIVHLKLEQTDCPKCMLEEIQPYWNNFDLPTQHAYLRIYWHMMSNQRIWKNSFFVKNYNQRGKAVILAEYLMNYLELSVEPSLVRKMSTFYVTEEDQEQIRKIIAEILPLVVELPIKVRNGNY